MTQQTPSMVSDVSATLVETMILRRGWGLTAASWTSGGSSPCRGRMAQDFAEGLWVRASMVRLIS